MLPLSGIRLVSLATTYPGPLAGMVLSDLGADVIVIENPKAPDTARRLPAFYAAINRGKRSIALDLKDPAGRDAFLAVVSGADVVVESFRPGVAARLSVDHEALQAVEPRLVYISISGYGQDGPMASVPAHDINLQAESGMLAASGTNAWATGFVEGPPVELADLFTGMIVVQAILLGLYERERTGRGPHLDVSMLDSLVSVLAPHLVPVVNQTGPPGVRYEAGYGLFATADGQLLALGIAGEDHFWQALCDELDLADLRAMTAQERLDTPEKAREQMIEAFSRRPRDEWIAVMRPRGIPVSPIVALSDVPAHPQVTARGLLRTVVRSDGSHERFIRQPLVVDTSAPGPSGPAPELGADTVEVLIESGLDAAAVKALVARGVALDGSRSQALTPAGAEVTA